MRKLILVLITVILHYTSVAQVKQGKAVYSIDLSGLLEKNIEHSNPRFSKQIQGVVSAAASVQLALVFNDTEAVFKQIDAMPSDAQSPQYYQMASVLSSDGSYYVNRDEKLVLKTVENEKTYLIRVPFETPDDWKLSKETRKIGKYQCYKATLTKTVSNSKGDFKVPVTAWYAPEIPAAFGPKNYHGLPGLILELQEGDRVYRCISIALNQAEKIAIARPEKGISLTQAAYQELMRKKLEDFKKRIQ